MIKAIRIKMDNLGKLVKGNQNSVVNNAALDKCGALPILFGILALTITFTPYSFFPQNLVATGSVCNR